MAWKNVTVLQAASRSLAIALVAMIAAGCGPSGPELIPVSGVVTIDGTPAKEGGVTFRQVGNPNLQLVGSIGPDGKYAIRNRKEFGAPQGDYEVSVVVTETAQKPDGSYTGLPKTVSNAKYADPGISPLKITVQKDAPAGAYDLEVTK